MRKFLDRHGLQKAYCRGCAVGLKDDVGVPIAKPWRIETNVPALHKTLDSCRCPGKAQHPVHSECQGKYARVSESYTPVMARRVHKAFEQHTNNREAVWTADPAAPARVVADETGGASPTVAPLVSDADIPEPQGLLPNLSLIHI